jgi:hypothetical protein
VCVIGISQEHGSNQHGRCPRNKVVHWRH